MKKLFSSLRSAPPAMFVATFAPLTDIQNSPLLSNVFSPNASLSSFINGIFFAAISIGAILAVLRIAYAGYLYMGAADMWGNKNKAKDILSNAVIGLLLLLATWIILHTINPAILTLNITQQQAATIPAQQQTQQQAAPNPTSAGGEYTKYQWENTGTDSSGNVQSCQDKNGQCWRDVGSNYCGASASGGTNTCCAYDSQCAAQLQQTTQTESSAATNNTSATDATSYPNSTNLSGWCFQSQNGIYECHTTQAGCMNSLDSTNQISGSCTQH